MFKFEKLERQEIPFKYDGKNYVLREATGGAGKQFQNARASCIVMGQDGKPAGLRNVGNLEPMLVHLCVFEEKAEGRFVQVSQATVEGWPYKVQKELFEKAKEISGIEDEDPLRNRLVEVLKRDDAPITFEVLQKWVMSLEAGEDTKALHDFFKPTTEEEAKNVQSDTETG